MSRVFSFAWRPPSRIVDQIEIGLAPIEEWKTTREFARTVTTQRACVGGEPAGNV
jgi:hypothetical protein